MNELLFLLLLLVDLSLVLVFFRLWGKTGIIVFYILHIFLSQITVKLHIGFFGLTVVFGSILYSVLFLCTDLLTEHYGKTEGYRAVLIGIASLLVFISIVQAASLFQPSGDASMITTFSQLFESQWRVVLADIVVSYLLLQSFDIWFFDRIRRWTKDRMLWLRNTLSTAVSQTITAILFFQLAFAGTLPQGVLWQIIFGGLAMKLIVGVLDTPFIYLSYRFRPKELSS